MNAEAFLDTSVLLYASAPGDPRAAAATAALAEGGVISVQVLTEFTSIARFRLRRSWPEVHEALSVFRILCPKPLAIRLATYEAALELVQQEELSFPNALVVASALRAGCSRLFSEMASNGRVIGERLTVCNPFAVVNC